MSCMYDILSQVYGPETSYLSAPQFREYLHAVHKVLSGIHVPGVEELGIACMQDFLDVNPSLCINPQDVDVALYVLAQNGINNGEHRAHVFREVFGVHMQGIQDERILSRIENTYKEKTRRTLAALSKPSLTAQVIQGPWREPTRSHRQMGK